MEKDSNLIRRPSFERTVDRRRDSSRAHACRCAIGLAFGIVIVLGIEGRPARAQTPFTFDPYVSYVSGGESSGIDALDLDGDCDLDLAVSNRSTNDVTIFLNNGDGTFAPGVSYPVGTTPRYVFGADLDGDDDIDLVTSDWDSHTVSILTNRGDGVFDLTSQYVIYRPSWLTLFDVDNDQDVDIFITKWDNSVAMPSVNPTIVTILYNDGLGNFTEIVQEFIDVRPRGGAVGDFNNDGWPDVVIAHLETTTLSIVYNDHGAFTQAPVTLVGGTSPRYATAVDLDGDLDLDLAVVNKDSDDLWIYRNDGAGNFSSVVADRYATEPFPHSIVSADLDRDGDADLVVSNVGSGLVDLLENDGTGAFTIQKISSPGGCAHVVAADLQPDGTIDIAAASIGIGKALVHLNRTPQILEACDTNRDGVIGVNDLLTLLSAWGPCPIEGPCPADSNGDCTINVVDLLHLLSVWG